MSESIQYQTIEDMVGEVRCGNLDFLEPVLASGDCINSLSDGGAHCGTICDAAATTFLLQHWVRDRVKCPKP